MFIPCSFTGKNTCPSLYHQTHVLQASIADMSEEAGPKSTHLQEHLAKFSSMTACEKGDSIKFCRIVKVFLESEKKIVMSFGADVFSASETAVCPIVRASSLPSLFPVPTVPKVSKLKDKRTTALTFEAAAHKYSSSINWSWARSSDRVKQLIGKNSLNEDV